MTPALTVDRLQFATTITFHYLCAQLTMGLAFLIVLFGILGYRPAAARKATRGRRTSDGDSPSPSPSALPPVCRWSFNSAPTGRASRSSPAA
jgi:hypothetical protein